VNSSLNQIPEDNIMMIRNHPLSLSPTGSPHQHQPVSPTGSSSGGGGGSSLLTQVSAQHHAHSNHNHSHSNGGPPSKRSKGGGASGGANTGGSGGSFGSSNGYETTNVEYKPTILSTVTGGGQLLVDAVPGNLTTVVLSNGATTNVANKQLVVNPASITKIVKNDAKANG
jgi:hypothetical protein